MVPFLSTLIILSVLRLKSLKLVGFKSFAHATTLPFSRPITAIVGPNGCGKSNIIDAIRWVLGESSAKALRGGMMRDVIFAGSESERARGLASVELVFEQSAAQATDRTDDASAVHHANNIDADIDANPKSAKLSKSAKKISTRALSLNDFAELAIKRQIDGTGKSDYFLNGTKVRRADIHNTLLGTGLLGGSYAIIEQGMVAKIALADGQTLRGFIEEAAGVARYSVRRGETQKQLAAARANLELATGARDGLLRAQKRLQKDAAAAVKAAHLTAQIWQIGAQILTLEIATRQNTAANLADEYAQTKTKLSAQQAKLDAINNEWQQQQAVQTQISHQLNALTERAQECRQTLASQKFAQSHNQQQVAHLQENLAQTTHFLQDLPNDDAANLAQQITQLATDIAAIKSAKNTHQTAHERTAQQLQIAQQDAKTLAATIQTAEHELLEIHAHLAQSLPYAEPVPPDFAPLPPDFAPKIAALDRQLQTARNELAVHKNAQAAAQQALDQARKHATQATFARVKKHSEHAALQGLLADDGTSDYPDDDNPSNTKNLPTVGGALILRKDLPYDLSPDLLPRLDGFLSAIWAQPIGDWAAIRAADGGLITTNDNDIGANSTRQPKRNFADLLAADLLNNNCARGDGNTSTNAGTKAIALSSFIQSPNLPLFHAVFLVLDLKIKSNNQNNYSHLTANASFTELAAHYHVPHALGLVLPNGVFVHRFGVFNFAKKDSGAFVVYQQNLAKLTQLTQDLAECTAFEAKTQSAQTAAEQQVAAVTIKVQNAEQRVAAIAYEHAQKSAQQAQFVAEYKAQTAAKCAHDASVARFEKQAREWTDAQTKRQTRADELTQTLATYAAQSADLATQHNILAGELTIQKTALDDATEQLRARQFAHKTATAQHATAKAAAQKRQQLQQTQQACRAQLEKLCAQSPKLAANLANTEQENTRLTAEINTQKQALFAQKTRVQTLAAQHAEQIAHVHTLQQHITELAPQLAVAKARADDSQNAFSAHFATLSQLDNAAKTALLTSDWIRQDESRAAQMTDFLQALQTQKPQTQDAQNELTTSKQQTIRDLLTARHYLLATNAHQNAVFVSPAATQSRFFHSKNYKKYTSSNPAYAAVDWRIFLPESLVPKTSQQSAQQNALKKQQKLAQAQLAALGALNHTAAAALADIETQLAPLCAKINDLEASIDKLVRAINQLNRDTKTRFLTTLDAVNAKFSALFADMFDGGSASLTLADNPPWASTIGNRRADTTETQSANASRWQNPLVLSATPAGKKVHRLAQLSGGEKTLTALALIFAIFAQHPAPFCVLDEVDAPLDDANVARFGRLIHRFSAQVQFIFISHNHAAMQFADQLLGITMPNAGVSTVLPVDLTAAMAFLDTTKQAND